MGVLRLVGTQGVLRGWQRWARARAGATRWCWPCSRAVIVGGLVHYGRGLGDDDAGRPAAPGAPRPAPHRAAEATAQLEGAPPTDPAAPPAPRPVAPAGTAARPPRSGCADCPTGRAAWRGCSRRSPATAPCATRPARTTTATPSSSPTSASSSALGQPVTVTYDQVKDPEQVERWLLAAARPGPPHGDPGRPRRPLHLQGRREPAGADHRRCTSGSPTSSRSTPRARRPLAEPGRSIVRQRPPQTIRGVSNT